MHDKIQWCSKFNPGPICKKNVYAPPRPPNFMGSNSVNLTWALLLIFQRYVNRDYSQEAVLWYRLNTWKLYLTFSSLFIICSTQATQ